MRQLPILFLPGTLCTTAMFAEQIAHLTQFSDKVDVVQFTTENTLTAMADKVIAATNNQPCALVGFSMGGIVALEVARIRPDLVAKLAMVNSNCHADLPERKAARKTQIAQAKTNLVELMTSTFMPNYLYQANEERQALILAMATELGAECFAAQVMAIEDRPEKLVVLQDLASEPNAADILFIAGAQDKVCPPDHQKMMHKHVKNSELALIDKCGHFSPLEQAEQVSSLLALWYQK